MRCRRITHLQKDPRLNLVRSSLCAVKTRNAGDARVAAVALALVTLVSRDVAGQQTVTSATLSGRVEDAADASVSGATIVAINLETNQQATAVTDSDGRFRFAYLQVRSL